VSTAAKDSRALCPYPCAVQARSERRQICMGEASQRKRRMHALLRAQPWCIYCGGVNEATTTDHMPPRPRGLEFSACEPCNSGGRVAEKIVGLVSRIYPDPANDAGREELKRLYREFASHHPDLLEEMWPTDDQLQQEANLPASTHVLNARGPLLNKAMNRFAAKLALALHFKMTGAIASTAAAVAGRWYSNHQAYTGAIPDILLQAIRDAAGTLVQGKWNVGEQFAYAGAHTPSRKQSLFVARFRAAFAVAGMVYDDLEPPEVEGFSVVRPGFLRSNS
jgi:hypothetical protein